MRASRSRIIVLSALSWAAERRALFTSMGSPVSAAQPLESGSVGSLTRSTPFCLAAQSVMRWVALSSSGSKKRPACSLVSVTSSGRTPSNSASSRRVVTAMESLFGN